MSKKSDKELREFKGRLDKAASNGELTQLEIYLKECNEVGEDYAYLKYGALEAAAKGGHIEAMQLLIEDGADDLNGALKAAAEGGHFDIMEWLIEEGADDLNGALKGAAKGGHIDVMEWFIEQGANDFDRALRGAAKGGHINVMEWLIDQGVTDIESPLKSAAAGGHVDAMKFLLEKGADGNWYDNALDSAAKGGHIDAMKFLIKKGAKGYTPLAHASQGGYIDAMKLLIENGADDYNTALSWATTESQIDAMKFLLDNGANIGDEILTRANEDPTLEESKLIIAAHLADKILSKPKVLALPDDLSKDQLELISQRIASKVQTRKELDELEEYIDNIEGHETLKSAVSLHVTQPIEANERSFEFASAEMLQILEPKKFQTAIPYSDLEEFTEFDPKITKDGTREVEDGTTDIEVTYKSYQDEIFSKDDKNTEADHILIANYLNTKFESKEARDAFIHNLENAAVKNPEHHLKNIDKIIDNPIIDEEHKAGLRELKTELLPIVIKTREIAEAKSGAGFGAGEGFVPSAGAGFEFDTGSDEDLLARMDAAMIESLQSDGTDIEGFDPRDAFEDNVDATMLSSDAGAGEDVTPSAEFSFEVGAGKYVVSNTGEGFAPSPTDGVGVGFEAGAGEGHAVVSGVASAGAGLHSEVTNVVERARTSSNIADKVKAAALQGRVSKSPRRRSHVETLEATRKRTKINTKGI